MVGIYDLSSSTVVVACYNMAHILNVLDFYPYHDVIDVELVKVKVHVHSKNNKEVRSNPVF